MMGSLSDNGMKLVQEQRQQLSQNQLLALRILQCNAQELEKIVSTALLENPMLEKEEYTETSEEKLLRFPENVFTTGLGCTGSGMSGNFQADDISNYIYAAVPKEQTLSEYLKSQIDFIQLGRNERVAAEYIIDSLDNNGFRTQRATEIAAALGQTRDEVIKVIQVIQDLDPPGIAALNLRECLKLQLKRLKIYDETYRIIIDSYLEDLGANKISHIAKDLDIGPAETQKRCSIIRALNPKPGASVAPLQEIQYISPDFYVFEENGEIVVLANERLTPRLKVNSYYEHLLRAEKSDADLAAYIREKKKAALRMVEAIERRRVTTMDVVRCIFRRQGGFIRQSTIGMEPLTLSDIAKELEVYPSTVSRAINGKYVQTPFGLFPLKFFFTSSVKNSEGHDLSSEYVRSLITEIVTREDKKKPFSDEILRRKLKEIYHIEISRRTVTKYRDLCGIPNYSIRRMAQEKR